MIPQAGSRVIMRALAVESAVNKIWCGLLTFKITAEGLFAIVKGSVIGNERAKRSLFR